MAKIRMQGVTDDSLIPTPPAGKASFFYNSSDRAYKSKLDDGTIVVVSVSEEFVEDLVGSMFQDSATTSVVYNDAGSEISLEVIQTALNPSLIPNTPSGSISSTNVQAAINELGTEKANLSLIGMPNGLAGLDANSKVPTENLPALVITDVFTVSSQAAMLALVAEKGDVAIRLDIRKSFILSSMSPTTLADWKELLSPLDSVTSVNGLVGTVVLDTSNIAESLNKRYVSDFQKTEIDTIGNHSHVNSATNITTPVSASASIVSEMTLSPLAGTHVVTYNGQYSTTATAITALAAADLTTAYNYIQGLTATGSHVLVFVTETITPGVYDVAGAGSITTMATVTLDGQGNPNSIFIFRMSGAFSSGASANVILINGAQASNVFWVAQGAISLGASTAMVGTLLSQVGASAAAGCVVNGRLSSLGGAVTITTSTVTKPSTASQVTLGAFNKFALFTNSGGVGATGACTVTGDVGTNAGAITGFETSTVNGSFYTSISISSALTFSIYNNGVLVPNSSREINSSSSSTAVNISLDAVVTTLTGQSLDVRVKVDSGTMTTNNRTFITVQLGG